MADIFFYLIPTNRYRQNALTVFSLPENRFWHRTNGENVIATQPTISSRESTPAPDLRSPPADQSSSESLTLTFGKLFELLASKQLPDLKDGICFGTDPSSCHVLLGHRGTPGISAKQYAISVDSDGGAWLRDCSSTHGTAVECDKQNSKEVQKNCSWILTRPERDIFHEIAILTGKVHLEIRFPNHTLWRSQYQENVQIFYRKCQEAARRNASDESAAALGRLIVDSARSTAAPSGAATPRTGSIYYKLTILGEGSFGRVFKVIEAHSGQYYAAKTFIPPSNEGRRDEVHSRWLSQIQREYAFTANRPHANIVRAFELRDIPEPTIIMAYYPDGNIADAADAMDEAAYISACGQVLCALQHLHNQGIIHRDLKPENILVQLKPYLTFVVADFGLANVMHNDTLRKTFCGTLRYAAPEVFPGSAGHSSSADVWSLGVLSLEWIYRIPELPPICKSSSATHWRLWCDQWYSRLRKNLEDEEDCNLVQMLFGMIEVEVSARWTATSCLEYGLSRNLFRMRSADSLIVCIHDRIDTIGDAERNINFNILETDELQGANSTTVTPTVIDDSISQIGKGNDNSEPSVINSDKTRILVSANNQPSLARGPEHSNPSVWRLSHPYLGVQKQRLDTVQAIDDTIPHPGVSHLSTRSILALNDNYVYVVIRRQRITMRKSDHYINASEIATAGGLSSVQRRSLFRKYQIKGAKTRGHHHHWVPVNTALKLCKELKLEKELTHLFAYHNTPPTINTELHTNPRRGAPRLLPEGFAILSWDQIEVAYKPVGRIINATHIFKLTNLNKNLLYPYLKTLVHTRQVKGNWSTSGTYIVFEAAVAMCAHFHVRDQPLLQLIEDHPKETHNDELQEEQQDEEENKGKGEEDSGEDNNDGDNRYLLGLCGTYDAFSGWDGGVDGGEVENGLAGVDSNETTLATGHSIPKNTQYTEPSYSRGSFLGPPWTSFADILK
ncbi:hypothetical protein M433DRAFT_7455 [Acidomyces richmondensis BFW]|nr:hypothetical protein M433DRAFT_7455 [Acidomyces richmondensis BFW]